MALGCRVLLVCDDDNMATYLKEQLIYDAGHSVSFEASGQGALSALAQNNYDIVISQFGIFDLGPEDLMRGLKKADPGCVIIAFLQEEPNDETKQALSKLGVYDYICRPVNLEKLFFLVKKGMELRSMMLVSHKLSEGLKERNVALEKQNVLLTRRVEESTKNLTRLYEDLRTTYMRTIKVLAQAIDARDHYTHSHSENVATIAATIATEMNLSAKDIETIREACELHDLGKIGVEDSILSKPSSLTEQEWDQIKRHPTIAVQILEPLTFLHNVIDIIRQHHEHFDGSGYPDGRKGEDILLGARIVHLADAYESMRSARSYRKVPLTKEETIEEISRNSGTQFDPKVVEVFLRVADGL